MPDDDHLLATVLPKSRPRPTTQEQADLRQWKKVFGSGFAGVFLHVSSAGFRESRPKQSGINA